LVASSNATGSYPVTFTSTTLSICTVVNGAINVVIAGTCSITASQAGDATYAAASSVSKSITITKLAQTITFTQPSAMTVTSTDQPLVATSNATGSYPVTFTSTTLSTCTIVNGAIHVVSAGTCSITASQAGDGTYAAASSVSKSITITKLAQTITFTQPSAMTMTTADQPLVATSNATGSYPVTFTSTTLSICTVVNGAIKVVSAGTCSITASQAGDGTYAAAANVSRSISVMQAQATLTISNSDASNIAKGATGITLATTGGSGTGAVSFSVTGAGCLYNANSKVLTVSTLTQPNLGVSCSVTATKAASGTYLVSTSLPKIFIFK